MTAQRILGRMKHIREMYKFTQFVDEQVKEAEKDADEDGNMLYPRKEEVVGLYAEANGRPITGVWDLLHSCIEDHYVKEDHYSIHIFVHPGKGRHLLDKILFIPDGLIDESLRQFSAFWQFVTGAFFLGILFLLSRIILLLYHKV